MCRVRQVQARAQIDRPIVNIREQIEGHIQYLLEQIVVEDLRQNQLEEEGKIHEAQAAETRGIRMELMVAVLEARLHNRPIDLVDHVQRAVFQHIRELRAEYMIKIRNQQWRQADKLGILIDKMNADIERRCNIREGLMAQRGL